MGCTNHTPRARRLQYLITMQRSACAGKGTTDGGKQFTAGLCGLYCDLHKYCTVDDFQKNYAVKEPNSSLLGELQNAIGAAMCVEKQIQAELNGDDPNSMMGRWAKRAAERRAELYDGRPRTASQTTFVMQETVKELNELNEIVNDGLLSATDQEQKILAKIKATQYVVLFHLLPDNDEDDKFGLRLEINGIDVPFTSIINDDGETGPRSLSSLSRSAVPLALLSEQIPTLPIGLRRILGVESEQLTK